MGYNIVMEYGQQPEINDEHLNQAKTLITVLGFGEHVDRVVTYGDQKLTIAEGMAMHWHETEKLDGEALYNKVATYIEIADQQSM